MLNDFSWSAKIISFSIGTYHQGGHSNLIMKQYDFGVTFDRHPLWKRDWRLEKMQNIQKSVARSNLEL